LVVMNAASSGFSQTAYIDSLQRQLRNAKHDSTSMQLNFELSKLVDSYDINKAQQYLKDGYALAKKLNDRYYIAHYYMRRGALLFDLARYDTAAVCFDSSIVLYNNLINKTADENKRQAYILGKTDCLIGKGLLSAKLYNYHESTQYYLEGIELVQQIPGSEKNSALVTLFIDISSNYFELEQFEQSLYYDKKLLPYLDSNRNMDMYVIGNLYISDDYSSLNRFDSSLMYLEKVRDIVKRKEKAYLDIRFYYILGSIQRRRKEWSEALVSFQKANEAAKKMNDDFQAVNSNEGIAACYVQLGNKEKAREVALQVLNESNRINVPLGKVQALQLLIDIEEKDGNIEKAFQYQKQFILLNDSLKKEKVQRQLHEIEARYQTAQKEKDILELQKSNALQSLSLQKKSTFNYFLIGSVVALLVTGFLGYLNLRHRHQLAKQQDELQKQRIIELEKDKQLVAVDSLLKGQEEERSRLAKDLHDGLGGLLSGVKFSLSNMKDNLIVTPDNMAVFERSLDMLDTSIRELRRVAHNMMPEMLTKFGLDETLKEYFNSLNAANLLVVNYQSVGLTNRLDGNTEIIIYRIIQELMNNILKHAAASQVFVQLIKDNNRLNVVIEDNGKGFDTAMLENNKGAGWVNIRSRVEYLKGQLDIHSEPGKGTLVNIEFNV